MSEDDGAMTWAKAERNQGTIAATLTESSDKCMDNGMLTSPVWRFLCPKPKDSGASVVIPF
jgi:hypothetical protein